MIKRLLALLLFLNVSCAYAQTIKTDVLVIGCTPSGVAAAIQSARSKAKTVLMVESSKLPSYFADGTKGAIKADTVKNLSIQFNTSFIDIVKDDDRWEVTCTINGKTETIKTRVVIDATKNAGVIAKAGATFTGFSNPLSITEVTAYRTSIAMGIEPIAGTDETNYDYPPYPAYFVPIKAFVAKGVDNLLVTEKIFNLKDGIGELPVQLTIGQGAGVIAAYCAFFKTTTANLKVRTIQTESLDFKGNLLPFEDLNDEPQWRAIQQVCATGMLKGVQKKTGGKIAFIFDPDSTVTTVEVKPVLLEIYTRAFLWFNKEKPGKDFTVRNLLSLISEITLTDPEILQKNIARNWNTQYKFKLDFDMDRPITRREFAILANQYLNPFARTVDLGGKIMN